MKKTSEIHGDYLRKLQKEYGKRLATEDLYCGSAPRRRRRLIKEMGKVATRWAKCVDKENKEEMEEPISVVFNNYIIYGDPTRVQSIKHLACGRTSYNLNDVKYRYCGACNKYLDEE